MIEVVLPTLLIARSGPFTERLAEALTSVLIESRGRAADRYKSDGPFYAGGWPDAWDGPFGHASDGPFGHGRNG